MRSCARPPRAMCQTLNPKRTWATSEASSLALDGIVAVGAGRHLHLRCARRLAARRRVGVVVSFSTLRKHLGSGAPTIFRVIEMTTRGRQAALLCARDLVRFASLRSRTAKMALRQAAARFAALGSVSRTTATRAFGSSATRFSTEEQKQSVLSFMQAFEAVKPSTMDNPSTPSDFLKPLPEVQAQPPAKLTLNFFVPHNVEFEGAEVDQVQVPATSGDMGVLPGHVPTVVQMRPGVVAVTMNDKETQKVRAYGLVEATAGVQKTIYRRRIASQHRSRGGNPTAY